MADKTSAQIQRIKARVTPSPKGQTPLNGYGAGPVGKPARKSVSPTAAPKIYPKRTSATTGLNAIKQSDKDAGKKA